MSAQLEAIRRRLSPEILKMVDEVDRTLVAYALSTRIEQRFHQCTSVYRFGEAMRAWRTRSSRTSER